YYTTTKLMDTINRGAARFYQLGLYRYAHASFQVERHMTLPHAYFIREDLLCNYHDSSAPVPNTLVEVLFLHGNVGVYRRRGFDSIEMHCKEFWKKIRMRYYLEVGETYPSD